mgnify:CR=1 FL=1
MHIVLVTPQIPQNTGNISRLCAGTNVDLHLVKPLGFSLEDRYLKRAGLDYWPHVKLHIHERLEDALGSVDPGQVAYYSTHAHQPYTEFEPTGEPWFVFGCETSGLPDELLAEQADRTYTIPITDHVRSLNLANACAVVLYEAAARNGFDFGV